MRVEIRSAGLAAILICIVLLSGAVFAMGLLAGYDVAHQSQMASQQVATNYPLVPSSAAPSSVVAPSVAPAAYATPSARLAEQSVPSASTSTTIAPRNREVNRGPVESDGVADNSAIAPPPIEAPPPPARMAAAEATPPRLHHKPYNIQIQAAMDSTSATEMMRRLTALGYRPHLVPTRINSETWYKVEVGPYATQAEASAAETALRERYNSQFSRGATAPEGGGDEDE